jgi:hypothetical protein
MNKEQVNSDVSLLKNALVAHISPTPPAVSGFALATFNLPARSGTTPANISAYVQAVLNGLGLPSPIACPRVSGVASGPVSAPSAPEDAAPSEVEEELVVPAAASSSSSSSSSAASSGSENFVANFVAQNPTLGFNSDGNPVNNPAAPGFRPPQNLGEVRQLRSFSRQAGGALSTANLSWVIQKILQNSHKNSDYLVHNGKQVLHVPCSEEMAKRFCAPIYMNYIGVKVDSVCDAMTLDTYKHIPGGLEDSYISSLGLDSAAAKAVFKKWDDRVKSILDELASAGLPATGAAFPNPLPKPVVQSITVLSGVNPIVRDAVYAANAPGAIARMVQPQMFTVGYAKPLLSSMHGGASQNPHAPLYPKLVMNGGASPFALYGGNEAVKTMVKVIQNRIDALKTEYKAVSGEDLASGINSQIASYVTKVSDGFTGLENDLRDLRDANGYLAQYPLSEGLPRPSDASSLKSLADKGRDVSEKSLRLSKQVGKLSEIEKLLSELVANARPKKVSY